MRRSLPAWLHRISHWRSSVLFAGTMRMPVRSQTSDHKNTQNTTAVPLHKHPIMEFDSHKAGMEKVNKAAVQEKINEMSKGSYFYLNTQKKVEARDRKIAATRQQWLKYDTMSEAERAAVHARVDALEAEEEQQRAVGTYIHLDMDMFYAAVEEKHDPKLKTVPFGVGSISMLSTTNYLARQYGVRSGMPGFIGRGLCPDLCIVPCHFDLYRAESAKVRDIGVTYDPHCTSMGLDEVTIEISDYLRKNPSKTPVSVATELRCRIFQATNLTSSCGIASTATMAKMASNVNKPNGQHEHMLRTPESIKKFFATLPVRHIPGIGKAQEDILDGLGIHTCGDIYANRYRLRACFQDKTFRFFLSAGLGTVGNRSDKVRLDLTASGVLVPKSISREKTVENRLTPLGMKQLAQSQLKITVRELLEQNLRCGVLTLRLKRHTFDTNQYSTTFSAPTCDLETLMKALSDRISPFLRESEYFRLVGVSLRNLVPSDGTQPISEATVASISTENENSEQPDPRHAMGPYRGHATTRIVLVKEDEEFEGMDEAESEPAAVPVPVQKSTPATPKALKAGKKGNSSPTSAAGDAPPVGFPEAHQKPVWKAPKKGGPPTPRHLQTMVAPEDRTDEQEVVPTSSGTAVNQSPAAATTPPASVAAPSTTAAALPPTKKRMMMRPVAKK